MLDLRCVKPLASEVLVELAKRYKKWLVVEEGTLLGGLGSALLEFLSDRDLKVRVRRCGIPDRFITHGDRTSLLREIGLDADGLKEEAAQLFAGKRLVVGKAAKQRVQV